MKKIRNSRHFIYTKRIFYFVWTIFFLYSLFQSIVEASYELAPNPLNVLNVLFFIIFLLLKVTSHVLHI